MIGKVAATLALYGVVIFGGLYLGSPVMVSTYLLGGVRAGGEGLEWQLDAAALRANLKPQLTRLNRGADLDFYVSPAGIAEILGSPGTLPIEHGAPAIPEGSLRRKLAYQGLNRFTVSTARAVEPNDPTIAVLERRNAFSWRLVDIRLPRTA
jgi:hypothetical protein